MSQHHIIVIIVISHGMGELSQRVSEAHAQLFITGILAPWQRDITL